MDLNEPRIGKALVFGLCRKECEFGHTIRTHRCNTSFPPCPFLCILCDPNCPVPSKDNKCNEKEGPAIVSVILGL